MSLISTVAMSKISPAVANKVRSAIKLSGSTVLDSLKKATVLTENNGIVPSIDSAMKMRTSTLIQLPGIVELLARTDKKDVDSHWKELESFVGAVGFFVGDKKAKLNNAREG